MRLYYMITWIVFIICIFQISASEGCQQNTCDANQYCIFNTIDGTTSCAQQLSTTPIYVTINSSITYIYYSPKAQSYISLEFQFCYQDLPNVTNVLTYAIQNSSNSYPDSSTNNVYKFPASSQCDLFYMANVRFSKDSNGALPKIVFALSLLSSTPVDQTLKVSVLKQTTINGMFIPLLVSVGCLLVLLITTAAILILRRRLGYRRRNITIPRKNMLDHFQTFMPKTKFQDLGSFASANCSVCLCDFAAGDVLRVTPCEHYFHSNCLDDWCKKALNCPICRQNLQQSALKLRQNTKKTDGLILQKQKMLEMTNLQTHLMEQPILESQTNRTQS